MILIGRNDCYKRKKKKYIYVCVCLEFPPDQGFPYKVNVNEIGKLKCI